MIAHTFHRVVVVFTVAILSIAAAACGRGEDGDPTPPASGGPSRSFLMGFSSLPRELNADAYSEAIEFADDHVDMLLIQRSVPWADFVPGAEISNETANNTASERRAVDANDLVLFFAIDPTDGATGRDRLGNLPVSLAGKRFDDPTIRSAFVSYAEYVARNYRPEYMALGVEINLYYEKNKEDFENYVSLYDEAYAAVKNASPATQVSVTFQYEDLQSLLPRDDRHLTSWQVLDAFKANTDFTAISTYPSFAFNSASDMPPNYYSQLRAFTDKPIVIADAGFSSATGQQGGGGTEEDQAAFVQRILDEAEELSMPFVVWFAIWDPSYARDTEYGAFQNIGLLRADNSEKPAWERWIAAARRPYVPVAPVAE